jgi:RNA polymerase-binding transcription factor DksA
MPLRPHLLSWEQRRVLRERLGARAAALRGELRCAFHQPDAPGAFALPDRRAETDDEALAELQSALDTAGAARDAQELAEVFAALERVDSPGFGRCAECGAPIAWARLLAQPQASHCIRCAVARETCAPATTRPPTL